MKVLRIGTRGSALALWQANHIKDKLAELHGVAAELVRIRTSGDHFQTASVAQIGAEFGTKGVFIKELEDTLLAGTVDLAVHSMKDVPTDTPRGLAFPAVTKREDPRDCLISSRWAKAGGIGARRAGGDEQPEAAGATTALSRRSRGARTAWECGYAAAKSGGG